MTHIYLSSLFSPPPAVFSLPNPPWNPPTFSTVSPPPSTTGSHPKSVKNNHHSHVYYNRKKKVGKRKDQEKISWSLVLVLVFVCYFVMIHKQLYSNLHQNHHNCPKSGLTLCLVKLMVNNFVFWSNIVHRSNKERCPNKIGKVEICVTFDFHGVNG